RWGRSAARRHGIRRVQHGAHRRGQPVSAGDRAGAGPDGDGARPRAGGCSAAGQCRGAGGLRPGRHGRAADHIGRVPSQGQETHTRREQLRPARNAGRGERYGAAARRQGERVRATGDAHGGGPTAEPALGTESRPPPRWRPALQHRRPGSLNGARETLLSAVDRAQSIGATEPVLVPTPMNGLSKTNRNRLTSEAVVVSPFDGLPSTSRPTALETCALLRTRFVAAARRPGMPAEAGPSATHVAMTARRVTLTRRVIARPRSRRLVSRRSARGERAVLIRNAPTGYEPGRLD